MSSNSDSAYTNTNDYYTTNGHVAGMLDRDQRTAKIPCEACLFQSVLEVLNNHNNYYIHARSDVNTKISQHRHSIKLKCTSTSRKNSYLWNTLRKLKQVLITGIYLLSLVCVPGSLSAPTKLQMAERMQSRPKWINPCGIDLSNGAFHDPNTQIPKVADAVLLDQIVLQANLALRSAEQFREDFTQVNFNSNFETLHGNWRETRYNWLPNQNQIPKSLGERISQEHLQRLKLDDALVDTYQYLQIIAVGLEQVVWDQEDNDGPFLRGFNQSEYNLRLVLCEIQMAIFERGIQEKMHADVSRDIWPDDTRRVEIGNTTRKLRDWIIYRDYMNVLEYIIQIFDYLKNSL